MAQIIDSYSETNYISTTEPIKGQSFTGDGGVLNKATFYLRKSGSPTGNVYAKIYAHSGTFGSTGVPTGSALATSDAVVASTFPTSLGLVDFTFSGANKITLTNGTKYFLVIDGASGDGNYIYLGQDTTSPSHAGNLAYYSGGWTADSTRDLVFYVYKDSSSPSLSPSSSVSLSPSDSVASSESPSPSTSTSLSPSISISLSPSTSLSRSPSISPSASPSPAVPFFGLRVAKDGANALLDSDPTKYKFHSDYGTLKYYSKETAQITIDGAVGDFAGTTSVTHGLGYYPYVEVYVKLTVAGSSDGKYEYVPFAGSGTSVTYNSKLKITTTQIVLYSEVYGVFSSEWVFDFLVFIYKNDLGF